MSASPVTVPLSKGAKVNADVSALLRARNTFLWLTTGEELRAERAVMEAGAAANYEVRFWDCATGITKADGSREAPDARDPGAALQWIRETAKGRTVLVMRDLHPWLKDPVVCRTVRTLARQFQGIKDRNLSRAIVVISPSSEIPMELGAQATVLDYPIPDRTEMARILDDIVSGIAENEATKANDPTVKATMLVSLLVGADGTGNVRDAAVDAAMGLSADGAASCFMKSLVTHKPPRIDPAIVRAEKKRAVSGVPGLSLIESETRGLAALGGHEELKPWVRARRAGFGVRARAYGLPEPKGIFLAGIAGTGKTLLSRCLAGEWELPLVKFDFGAVKSKFVGDSEGNLRRALAIVDAISPCVMLIDEFEKAFAGSTGAQGDGGVASDQLGYFLSWMQDRKSSVFVIATANEVRNLPPEILRKGRFDEVWWMDLPSADERGAVLTAALGQYNRAPMSAADVATVADACDGFTGSEIAALVPEAMFTAFADSERPIAVGDLLAAAKTVVPLSRTAEKKIADLREWAASRARSTTVRVTETSGASREIDL